MLLVGIPDYFASVDLSIKYIGTLFLKNNFLFIYCTYRKTNPTYARNTRRPWEGLKINKITVLKSDSEFGTYK